MERILNYLSDKYHGCIKYWWLILTSGIIVALLGIAVFLFPVISYATMSLLFGITILISGIVYIVVSTTKTLKRRGWLMISGIIEVILGILLTLMPFISAAVLPYFLGFWLLFKGFTLIGIGSDLSDVKGSGWGWTIIWALALIVCSFIIILYPLLFGVEAVIVWVGVSCIIAGCTLMSTAFNLKKGIE